MCIYDPSEKALWEKIEPWLEHGELREDTPTDVIEADKELKRIAWDLDRI